MTGEALIIMARNARTLHVYLQQEIDNDGGHWATRGKTNSDSGWSLYGDGRVFRQTYSAGGGECLRSERIPGTWLPLKRA